MINIEKLTLFEPFYTFTGTEKTSEDYRYSKSLKQDETFTQANGTNITGDGSETLYHENSYSFKGNDQTCDYYDSEGTQKGEKSFGSTVDTTLNYTWVRLSKTFEMT